MGSTGKASRISSTISKYKCHLVVLAVALVVLVVLVDRTNRLVAHVVLRCLVVLVELLKVNIFLFFFQPL